MDSTFRQKLLAYLGGVALSMAAGMTAVVQPELTAIPEEVIEELLNDVDGDSWRKKDLFKLVSLLAEDPRRQIKCCVLDLLTNFSETQSIQETEDIFYRFAQDPDHSISQVVASSFANWLSNIDGLERAALVNKWASSKNPPIRQVIAKALGFYFPVLAGDWVIEHLSNDPDATVREASAFAAEGRFNDNSVLYSSMLKRLASDPDRRVRQASRRAIVRRLVDPRVNRA